MPEDWLGKVGNDAPSDNDEGFIVVNAPSGRSPGLSHRRRGLDVSIELHRRLSGGYGLHRGLVAPDATMIVLERVRRLV